MPSCFKDELPIFVKLRYRSKSSGAFRFDSPSSVIFVLARYSCLSFVKVRICCMPRSVICVPVKLNQVRSIIFPILSIEPSPTFVPSSSRNVSALELILQNPASEIFKLDNRSDSSLFAFRKRLRPASVTLVRVRSSDCKLVNVPTNSIAASPIEVSLRSSDSKSVSLATDSIAESVMCVWSRNKFFKCFAFARCTSPEPAISAPLNTTVFNRCSS